jgi:hypothetical protein
MRRRKKQREPLDDTRVAAPAPSPAESTSLTHACAMLCSAQASTLEVYRRALVLLLLVELYDRWAATGLLYGRHSVGARCIAILPSSLLDGYEWRPVLLLTALTAAASLITRGRVSARLALLTFALYTLLSIRAPTFFWILDRYAQTLLLLSVTLPQTPRSSGSGGDVVSSGAVALARLQVAWIYMDAAWVKVRSGAWWRADADVSALDVYLRHTTGSRLFRRALSPLGEELSLHVLSSLAVALEMTAPLVLLLACACGAPTTRRRLAGSALVMLAGLHLAIALTMSGTILLSALAAVALLLWLDVATTTTTTVFDVSRQRAGADVPAAGGQHAAVGGQHTTTGVAAVADGRGEGSERTRTLLLALVLAGCAAFESAGPPSTVAPPADATSAELSAASPPADANVPHNTTHMRLQQSGWEAELSHTLMVLLGNRWNVFGPAEPHVTWEIAPGRLADGSVVEVWRAHEAVSWSIPEPGQTLWHGRYRMLPFLSSTAADPDEAGTRFWETICSEWDRRQAVESRRLLRFKFFLLRAPLLRGGHSGPVGKTLIRAHTCTAGRE